METKKCYICGEEGADSVDHLPPQNIFLKRYRNMGADLITVPAHKICNEKCAKDDEYFRYCLTVAAYPESVLARELWDTKIKRQIHRAESGGFKEYLIEHLHPVELFTPSGIFLGNADLSSLDAKRMFSIIERIVKGIYYKNTGEVFPSECPVNAQLVNYRHVDLEMLTIRNQLGQIGSFVSIGNGIFRYYWEFEKENRVNGLFWFVFFDCVDFRVITGNPNVEEKI